MIFQRIGMDTFNRKVGNNLNVRFFKKSERQLLLDTIDRLWKHDHIYVRKPEVLEHFVLNTPYREAFAGKDNYSYVAMLDDDGRIVGIYGCIPQIFNIFVKNYPSETATTWLFDKECCSGANGLALRDFCYKKGIKAAVYFGLSDEAYRIDEAYGSFMTSDFPRWLCVLQKDSVKKYLLPKLLATNILPLIKHVECSNKYKIEIDELRDDKWDEFYFKHVAPVTVGTQRDYKFLLWRYGQSPILKYKFISVIDENKNFLGLAVIRKEEILDGALYLGRILEFISFDAEASIQLANAVTNYYSDIALWDFYCLSDITTYGLEMIGFRKSPSWMQHAMIPTRFHPVDLEHIKLNGAVYISDSIKYKINQLTSIPWYITRGDSDQDRAN